MEDESSSQYKINGNWWNKNRFEDIKTQPTINDPYLFDKKYLNAAFAKWNGDYEIRNEYRQNIWQFLDKQKQSDYETN